MSVRVWKSRKDDTLYVQFDDDECFEIRDGFMDLDPVGEVPASAVELVTKR